MLYGTHHTKHLLRLPRFIQVAVPLALVTVLVYAFAPLPDNGAPAHKPADRHATRQTKTLFENLFRLSNKGIMFGHQDDLAYGVGWQNVKGRSDIKSVVNDYPAVYGWELGHLELDSASNFDGVNFKQLTGFVKQVYARGGINTFSWHMIDPVTGQTAWSNTNHSVAQILTDDNQQKLYLAYLDKFAAFAAQLKGDGGEAIPIIFRPFHENTGDWFWWGSKACSPDDFKALWRLTVNYLQKDKKLHNILFAFSPADFDNQESYMATYPGDDYVDVLGFDIYVNNDAANFAATLDKRCAVVDQLASSHKKIAAVTEVGYENLPDATWWSQTLWPVLSKYKLSYMLTWRNWKDTHFFAPYPGQRSEADFKILYHDARSIFQQDMPVGMYKKTMR